jgi:hypothetical protein
VDDRHPCRTLAPAPTLQRPPAITPRRPGHRHAHRGHPSRASTPPSTSRDVTSPPDLPQSNRSIP